MSLVHVTFRKAVSDGNYGSEQAEVSFDVNVEDGQLEPDDAAEVFAEVAEEAIARARRIVTNELRQSPSPTVRHALGEPETAPALVDRDDLEELPY